MSAHHDLFRDWEQQLDALAAVQRLRHLDPVTPQRGTTLRDASGQQLCSFASNDYLGLACHPALALAASRAGQTWGSGAAASPLLGGETPAHAALAAALAQWLGVEAVLLFGSGYLANLGLLQAVLAPGDRVYLDRLVHASLIDGIRLAGARFRRFHHNDPEHLEGLLRKGGPGRPWIVTEGIFSMDGDMAPLPALVTLADRYGATVLLDEAHAFGVLGSGGRGSLAHWGLATDAVVARMGTLGKAFGSYGAFVAGSRTLVSYLTQRARAFIYHTGLPPMVVAASLEALKLVNHGDARRARLQQLRDQLRTLQPDGNWLPSTTPIQGLLLGSDRRAVEAAAVLRRAGFYCPAVRPPTVPESTARLRITLSAAHQPTQIAALCEALVGLS